MTPFFSVITVCFNAQSTVAPTMKSVAGQTFEDYEHIIQDGASTDDTLQLIRSLSTPRTLIESEPDGGLYHAMNKALERARGKYVVFLNAGDAFYDNSVLTEVHDAVVNSGIEPGVAYGQTVLVDSGGKITGPRHLTAPRHLSFRSFADGMVVCHQAFFARRDLAPGFNTAYRFSADYEWCLRILQKSKENLYINKPLIRYLEEGVTTANHKKSLRERYRIMCDYYGTIPTIFNHIRFLFRHLKRKI